MFPFVCHVRVGVRGGCTCPYTLPLLAKGERERRKRERRGGRGGGVKEGRRERERQTDRQTDRDR